MVARFRAPGLVYDHLEPQQPERAPERIVVDGVAYRRRDKHPNTVATLLGPVTLHRLLYESLEPGHPCLHPLERGLGIVAGSVMSDNYSSPPATIKIPHPALR